MTTYGTVTHNGVTYNLTTNADHTNRLLPAGYTNYHEAGEGEEYDFELSAHATHEGEEYIVYWLFVGRKGDDDPELDSYDYSVVDRAEPL